MGGSRNDAGFIGGAFIRPGTTNAQGVALEADPDDADSDDDGMSDADEAAGMFNPNDAGHRLAVISLTKSNDNVRITWIGKGGDTTNAVASCTDLLSGDFTNVLHRAAYAGGESPWFKMTNAHEWVSSVTNGFFRVVTE